MLASGVVTPTMSCPGVCPPTSTSSTPGASVSWLLKSVTRLSCRGPPEQGDLVRLGVRGEVGAGGHRRRPEVVLGLGQHELGVRELADVADVVPVRVGDDDRGDVSRVDAEGRQRLRGRRVVRPAAPVADLRREPGVDQRHPLRAAVALVADHPEVVVDVQVRVRLAVQVVVQVTLRVAGHAVPVPDREHAVLRHPVHPVDQLGLRSVPPSDRPGRPCRSPRAGR